MQLRDYQQNIKEQALGILREYNLVYLAMEVRTGKTITSLAIADAYGAKSILFVTKKKAINDIADQAARVVKGAKVHITNFEQLHNHEAEYDLIIIDEAHSIGAFPPVSVRTKQLKRLCAGRPIIYLSGTPSPESFSQLYHQFWVSSFSPFREWPSFYKWAREFVNVETKWIGGKPYKDYNNADYNKIYPLIKHIMISFTQEDAGFEQLVKEQILTVRMADMTYNLADTLRKKRIVKNPQGDVILADTGAKMMQKLHQIYSGSVIVDEPERKGRYFDTTKAEFIRDYFKGKRIAIFYKFLAEYAMLVEVFDRHITFDVDHFQSGKSNVFASQIVSGREGINLSSADALVFFNIDFSATSYFQARARLQTKDRDKEAIIYWIFAENGIEHKIYKAVSNKQDYTKKHFENDYKDTF